MTNSCFFLHYPLTPHLETELELIQKEIEQDNKVVVLRCDGALSSCTYNMEHSKVKCLSCKSRIDNALALLDSTKYEEVYLKKIPNKSVPFHPFQSIPELMAYRYKSVHSVGTFVASTLVSFFRDHGFSPLRYKKLISRLIASSNLIIDQFDALCAERKIGQVFLFNGRFSTVHSIMSVCKSRGIDFFVHERGGQLDKYSLIKNNTPHSITHAQAEIQQIWDNAPQEKRISVGSAFFEDRRNKVIQGWLSFTTRQKKNFVGSQITEAKKRGQKVIAIYTSSIDEVFAFDEWRSPNVLNQASFLDKLFTHYKDDSRFFFVVRVHPNLKGLKNLQNKEMSVLVNKFPNACIVAPHAKVDSYFLMDISDMVISFGSTVGVEATYWGKVSVLMDNAFYKGLDIAYEVNDLENLTRLIENVDTLTPKPKESTLKYGLWEYEKGIYFKHTKILGLFSAVFNNKSIEEKAVISFFAKLSEKLHRKFNFMLR